MDFKQLSHEKKPLLNREEFLVEMNGKTTPSIADVKKAFSEKLGKDEKLILVKKISHKFGLQSTRAKVYSYNNEESIKRFERFRKVKSAEAAK